MALSFALKILQADIRIISEITKLRIIKNKVIF